MALGQAKILKALALGATGTLIGRAYQHGLGAMGQAGVTKSLEILKKRTGFDHGVLWGQRY